MLIQLVVTFVAIAIVYVILFGKQTHATRAWKKIALVLLAIAMIVAVFLPDITTQIAHLFGVGRGADLLLYLLTLAFISYAINNYRHQQQDRDTINKLARKIALLDAQERNDDRKNDGR